MAKSQYIFRSFVTMGLLSLTEVEISRLLVCPGYNLKSYVEQGLAESWPPDCGVYF